MSLEEAEGRAEIDGNQFTVDQHLKKAEVYALLAIAGALHNQWGAK